MVSRVEPTGKGETPRSLCSTFIFSVDLTFLGNLVIIITLKNNHNNRIKAKKWERSKFILRRLAPTSNVKGRQWSP
jgi:hypothetical protein